MNQKVTVVCILCGKNETVNAPSPAAPMISALTDVLRPKGWTYSTTAGMFTGGYMPVCPACSEKRGD